MLYLAHGTEPEEEQPPIGELGTVRYLAVSEGVKHHLHEKYGIADVDLIRNPIDLNDFRSQRDIHAKPRRAILLKNAVDPQDWNILSEFFLKQGIDFDLVGAHKSRPDVANAINEADVVVTWGRGALEALACERAVIAYGHDHLVDGMVTTDNFYGLRTRSFSGRVGRHRLSKETLSHELKKYDPSRAKALRRQVSYDHASDSIVNLLLKHYVTLINPV